MSSRVRSPSLPVAMLLAVSVLSLGARVAWLGSPCHAPCTTSTDHLLIFDEAYYVNAARVIAGIAPPAGANYATSPLGDDPNSEHPQLVKLVIAGSIELFGDGPLAWRLGSLLAGSLAILGMWALARAAGAGRWIAFGAAGLMAADNLLLVAGRIGTLDIYAVAGMVWAVALYLRGRRLAGGLVLAVAIACKEVAAYAALVVVAVEACAWLVRRPRPSPLAGARGAVTFCAAAAAGFVGLLAVMDRIAPPWDPQTGALVSGGVLGHIGRMITYASGQSSPHGPRGIASYPWEWLGDYKPIPYLGIDPARPSHGLVHDHPATLFLGMISPPIMLLALPALAVAAVRVWRGGRAPRCAGEAGGPAAEAGGEFAPGRAAEIGLAWFLATFLPFELLSLIWQRTSYLYYMVIVMPGIYLAVAALVARHRQRRALVMTWIAAVLIAVVVMYPFDPLL